MWLGPGEFDNYGYFRGRAFVRGQYNGLNTALCYEIINGGVPNGSTQFWFMPIDQSGKALGPPAIQTAGQVAYSIWEDARRSSVFNNSSEYIQPRP